MATVAQFDFLVRASTDMAIQKLKQLGKAASETNAEIEQIETIDFSAWGRSAFEGASRAGKALWDLAKASSSVVEQQNFANQVFKEAAPAIQTWAKAAEKTALLSESAALKSAAYLGVFGQAIDLTGDDLAKFSINLVELAADLASVADTPVDTAVTAIGAALRNEYEPMRKYGIVLNDAILKQTLFDLTGEKVTGTLTQQQKILAVNQTLFQKLGFAIGDVDRTFSGMANQEKYLQANLENLKASIGDGLRPTFITLLEAANGVINVLGNMPPVAAEIGGKLALAATAVTGITGAFMLLASHGPKVVDSFHNMSTAFAKVNQQSGTMQKNLLNVGKAVGLVAVGFAAFDIAATAMNSANDIAGKFSKSLNEISAGNVTDDLERAYQGFLDLAAAQDKNIKMSHLWEDFGQRVKLPLDDASRSVEDLDAAFKEMLNQDPAAAANVLDYLEQQNSTLDQNSAQWKVNQDRIDAWRGKVEQTVTAQQLQGETTQFTQEQLKKYGDETLATQEAQDELAKSIEDLTKKYDKYRDAIGDINSDFLDGKVKAESFSQALDEATGTNAQLEGIFAIRDATEEMFSAFRDDEGNLDHALVNFNSLDQAGRDNLATIDSLAKTMGDELTRAFQESGGNAGIAARRQQELKNEFQWVATAAGLTTEEIDAMNQMLFATPDEIMIALELSGQEEAKAKLEALNMDLDDLPAQKQIAFSAAIERGDFVGAWDIAQQAIVEQGDLSVDLVAKGTPLGPILEDGQRQATENPYQVPVNAVPGDTTVATVEMQDDFNRNNPVDVPTKAKAGDTSQARSETQNDFNRNMPVDVPTKAKAGDTTQARNETQNDFNRNNPVEVPTKAKAGDTSQAHADMQNTLDNNPLYVKVKAALDRTFNSVVSGFGAGTTAAPTAGPQATAAAAPVAVPVPVMAGRQAPQTTVGVVNFNVQLPTGADETRVVAALRKYSKNMGALPIQIAS